MGTIGNVSQVLYIVYFKFFPIITKSMPCVNMCVLDAVSFIINQS